MAFGVNLKRERELRGITLDEISKATKVSVRLLKAIESDRFDILPEGVFRKSFVKSYAKYLGMNEEQVLQEYAVHFQTSSSSTTHPEKTAQSRGSAALSLNRPVAIALAVLLILAVIGMIYWYLSKSTTAPVEATAPNLPSPVASKPIPAPASVNVSEIPPKGATGSTSLGSTHAEKSAAPLTSNTPDTSSPASSLRVLGELAKKPSLPSPGPESPVATPGQGPLELSIQATEQIWLSVASGQSTLFSGLMNPQESRSFPLQSPLRVLLGNAGGVKLMVNGQLLGSMGKSRERKTIDISAENYRQYLLGNNQ